MATNTFYDSLHRNSSEMMRVVYLLPTKHIRTHAHTNTNTNVHILKWCKKQHTRMGLKMAYNRVQRGLIDGDVVDADDADADADDGDDTNIHCIVPCSCTKYFTFHSLERDFVDFFLN